MVSTLQYLLSYTWHARVVQSFRRLTWSNIIHKYFISLLTYIRTTISLNQQQLTINKHLNLVPIAKGLIHLWLKSATCHKNNFEYIDWNMQNVTKESGTKPLCFSQVVLHLLASLVIPINCDVVHVARYHKVLHHKYVCTHPLLSCIIHIGWSNHFHHNIAFNLTNVVNFFM